MSDIWNKRRELIEKKVIDSALELIEHSGAAAFELTVPGTSPELKITLGAMDRRAAPVVTEDVALLNLIADIRAAAGDKEGRLMQDELVASIEALRADAERMNYIERTFSGMTNRERYLPVTMIWGKGCNGRTIREACDKYMKRDAK